MPQFLLSIKADLENIRALIPVEGNLWKFDVQTLGGGDKREGVTVSTAETYPLEGSRGEANFIMKLPGTKEHAYIKIIAHKKVAKEYAEGSAGEFVPILALECRGVEIVKWYPSFDFDVVTTGGFMFSRDQVDLSDREWAEYDEENDLSVSISNLEYRVESA